MNSAETRALLAALRAAQASGQRAAIATVVGVRGSAYRREGARMLILESGVQVCMLSGGCLEAEVAEAALEVLRVGKPRVIPYDLSEDATWGLGIGCGGSVDIRIEPVGDDPLTAAWLLALERGDLAALVQPLRGPGRLLVTPEGVLGELPAPLHAFALAQARTRLEMAEPRAVTLEAPDGTPLFFDVSAPPPRLVLYGAGHDARPLSAQAHALGYEVHVVDPRPAFLTPELFPGAALHRLAPEDLALFTPPPRAALILMNHHLDRDRACLAHALGHAEEGEVGYVGVLGPRSRAERLLAELAGEGVTFSARQLAALRSPVGLRLGAEAPEEVALSILGELMARRRGYSGGFLSGHAGRIHDAPAHSAAPPSATPPEERS